MRPAFSVVVPFCDEAENVAPLLEEIFLALDGAGDFEVVAVDDGSQDATALKLAELERRRRPRLRWLRHRRRSGQSAALRSGVQAASHAWILTLDGDGQNDPRDIATFWAAFEAAGSAPPDLVAGIRKERRDSFGKRISSRIANGVRRALLRDGVSDTGCGLKLFRRDAFLALPWFDHMHRFLPALFRGHGGKVATVAVGHRPRRHGRSHYGVLDRLGAGVVDLFGVWWLLRRVRRVEIETLSRLHATDDGAVELSARIAELRR